MNFPTQKSVTVNGVQQTAAFIRRAPHKMNAYEIIIHEYALERRSHGDDTADEYRAATERMRSDDDLFREYCREAEMSDAEIEQALALK
jgi:hypothetical protein